MRGVAPIAVVAYTKVDAIRDNFFARESLNVCFEPVTAEIKSLLS
jgi:hypothetical protein